MTQPHAWLKNYPPQIAWDDASIKPFPVGDILTQAVARFGDKPFLNFEGKRWSYKQVGEMVDRLAANMQAGGIKSGSKVGLHMPNCPFYIVAYFAALKCGATVVNYNPLYSEAELAKKVGDSGTDVLVTLDIEVKADAKDAGSYSKAQKLLSEGKLKHVLLCPFADCLPQAQSRKWRLARFLRNILPAKYAAKIESALAKQGAPLPARIKQGTKGLWHFAKMQGRKKFVAPVISNDDLAVLQYTGGTTGVSKGAALSHGNLSINAQQSRLWFSNVQDGQEKYVAVLPFFHVFAMTSILNVGCIMGAELLIQPRFELKKMLALLEKEQPTMLAAVPAIYTALNAHFEAELAAGRSIDYAKSLKMSIAGGAALPPSVKQNFETLTGCRLVEGYGLSETSPVVSINPVTGINKPGSIGLPVPHTILSIRDLTDPSIILPAGQRGELAVEGPQVMQGYYGRPRETAEVMQGKALLTGDIAVMDSDGHFFIVDRKKRLIKRNGVNIPPRDVEDIIYEHAAVQECCVVGIADTQKTEEVVAYIQLKPGASIDVATLKAFVDSKVTPQYKPRHYVLGTEPLPKTLIGKVDYKAVEQLAAARFVSPSPARPAAPAVSPSSTPPASPL